MPIETLIREFNDLSMDLESAIAKDDFVLVRIVDRKVSRQMQAILESSPEDRSERLALLEFLLDQFALFPDDAGVKQTIRAKILQVAQAPLPT